MSTISFPASTPSSLHYFNVKSRSSFTFRGLISEPLIDICKSVFSTIKERPFETLSFTATVVLNWTHIKSQSPEIATLATGYQILHNGKTAWELIPQFKKKAFLNTVVKVSFFAIALYIGVAIPTIDTIAKYAVEEYIKCYQAGKSLEDCHALLPPWLNFDIKAIVKHPNQAISVTQTISSSKVCIYTKLTPYSHVSKTCFSDDHCPSEVFSDFEFPLPSPIAHGETHLEFTLYTGLNIRYYRFRLPLVIKENINPDICIVTHEVALNQTTKVCIDSENLMIVKQLIEDSEFNNHFDLPHSRAEIESTYVMFRQKHENELALSLPSAQQDVSAVEVHPLYTPNPGMLINVTIIKPKVSALKAYIESRKKPAIIKPPKKPTILQHFLKLFLLTPTDTPSDTSQEESLDSLSDEELLEGLKNVNENDKSHESEKTKSYFNALKKRILSDPFIVSVVIALVDKKQLSMAVAMAENIDDSKIKAKTAYVIIDKAIKKGHQNPHQML